jgi:hypothetical protein
LIRAKALSVLDACGKNEADKMALIRMARQISKQSIGSAYGQGILDSE